MLKQLQQELKKASNSTRARIMQRFFKTGKGQYGEGDVFLGLSVPEQRLIAKKYLDLSLPEIEELLKSKVHEHRFIALVILVSQYKKSDKLVKKAIYEFYMANSKRINNWDLVDSSAPNIVGDYLLDKDRSVIYQLARSENLWERRIAILSTFTFIRKHQLDDTLAIAEILINDDHDLIHKAVGWMLREVGKKSWKEEVDFLKVYCDSMPRVMLRYAIEKFPKEKRKQYLDGMV